MTHTPDMEEDMEEVAKRLTDAQQRLLLDLPTYAAESYPPAKWLVFKGLAERSDTGWLRATSSGHEVRAAILKAQGEQP